MARNHSFWGSTHHFLSFRSVEGKSAVKSQQRSTSPFFSLFKMVGRESSIVGGLILKCAATSINAVEQVFMSWTDCWLMKRLIEFRPGIRFLTTTLFPLPTRTVNSLLYTYKHGSDLTGLNIEIWRNLFCMSLSFNLILKQLHCIPQLPHISLPFWSSRDVQVLSSLIHPSP